VNLEIGMGLMEIAAKTIKGCKGIPVSLINMSHIYEKQQNFIQFLKNRKDACKFIDASFIVGTDCYCDETALQKLSGLLDAVEAYGVHFIDGGNYHYLSKIFTDKVQQPFDLIVIDHHHDMQPPAFGPILSCGGWLKEVLDSNSYLNKAFIIGVEGETVTEELKKNYSSVQFFTDNQMLAVYGKGDGTKEFYRRGYLYNAKLAQFIYDNIDIQYPVYISVDKDVLTETECMTNWDQGIINIESLECFLFLVLAHNPVIGIDICGEMDAATEEKCGDKWNEKNGALNIDLLKLCMNESSLCW